MAMLLSLLPTVALAADSHSHDVSVACGSDAAKTFVAWDGTDMDTETDGIQLTAGSYYLTADVEVTSVTYIVGEVNLCLNGKSMKYDGSALDSIIKIAAGASLNLCDCSAGNAGAITGGYQWDGSDGAGVYNAGTFTMYGGKITGNRAQQRLATGHGLGGGVYNTGTFTMYGGEITDNTADELGGGVYNEGSFTMIGGSVSNNKASINGAGVYNKGTQATVTLAGGAVNGNQAKVNGGGVYNDGGTFTMSGGSVSNNVAENYAGGVYSWGTRETLAVFTLSGGAIDGNTAENGGGGVNATYTNITMSGGSVSNNTTTNNMGGGITTSGNEAVFTMSAGTISNNKAVWGGGVYSGVRFTMTGGTITGNSALGSLMSNGNMDLTHAWGGGLYNVGVLTVNGGTISNNTAAYQGGGIYNGNSSTHSVSSGSITGNSAPNGGGIYLERGYFTLSCDAVSGNTAENGGGVYIDTSAKFILNNASITQNTATGNGGGVYHNGSELRAVGNAKIAGNTDGKNLYLNSGKVVTILSNYPLTEGASIGVTTSQTLPVAITGKGSKDYSEFFFSDDSANSHVENTGTGSSQVVKLMSGAAPAHVCSWSYTASGDTVSAVCSGKNCDSTANKTLTIVKPTLEKYEGSGVASATFGNGATSVGGVSTLPAIQYQKKLGENSYATATTTAPTVPGTYKASITVGEATASVEYTIAKGVNTSALSTSVANDGITSDRFTVTVADGDRNKDLEYKVQNGSYTDVVLDANGGFTVTVSDAYIGGSVSVHVREKETEYKEAGSVGSNLTVQLAKLITGVIRDNAGNPVEGATVKLMYTNDTVATVITGADGVYRFEKRNILGMYKVEATKDEVSNSISFIVGNKNTGKDITLNIGAVTPAQKPEFSANLSAAEVVYVQNTAAEALRVAARVTDGGTLSYQWYRNSVNSTTGAVAISGATGAAYTPATDTVGTTYYYCVVTNTKPGVESASAVSNIAMITVEEPAPTVYTVAFHAGEGSGTMASGTTIGGYILPANGFNAPANKQFKAWNVNGVEYAPGDIINVTANITVYAVWKQIEIVIPAYAINVNEPENGIVGVNMPFAYAGYTVFVMAKADDAHVLFKVSVTDKMGNPVVLQDMGNGVFTFMMPACDIVVSAKFMPDGSYFSCDGDAACPMYPYADLDCDAWYHDGVHYCMDAGLMQGIGIGKFDPDGTTTRAMIVTMLWRLEGKPVVNYLMQFEDVSADTWYTEAVRWAASEKIVEGWNGQFDPMGEITREQLATILWRYAQYKGYDVGAGEQTGILGYSDAHEVSAYAVPAMKWNCGVGLMQGNGKELTPGALATRAQAAALFQRFVEKVVNE